MCKATCLHIHFSVYTFKLIDKPMLQAATNTYKQILGGKL
jgi:hypothetical protein